MPRGGRRLPAACLLELERADLIVHAGDFTAARVLEELRTIGPPVEAVYGNMDDAALRAALPVERVVEVDGAQIGVVHIPGPAMGRHARLVARFSGCAAVVYGHTHVPEVATHEGVWIVNPGSPTERRRAPAHTIGIVEVTGARVRPQLLTLSP